MELATPVLMRQAKIKGRVKEMKTKIGKMVLSYSDSDIIESEIEYRMENKEDFGYDEDITEEEIYNEIDSEVFQDYYESFLEGLGRLFSKKFKNYCARVDGEDLNWRHSSGYKYLRVYEHIDGMFKEPNYQCMGAEIISKLFSGSDCSIEVYQWGKGIYIKIYHHDCPMGSSYYIKPCAESTVNRHLGY